MTVEEVVLASALHHWEMVAVETRHGDCYVTLVKPLHLGFMEEASKLQRFLDLREVLPPLLAQAHRAEGAYERLLGPGLDHIARLFGYAEKEALPGEIAQALEQSLQAAFGRP